MTPDEFDVSHEAQSDSDHPCLRMPTKQLILRCAQRLLRDHEMGNFRDKEGLSWARWIVKHNGPVIRPKDGE